MQKKDCLIIENKKIADGIYALSFECPEIAKEFKPGQFINLRILSDHLPVIRRPFSIADSADNIITILYQCVGPTTRNLSQCTAGCKIDVIGPLGNGFKIVDRGKALLVAGGIGSASLLAIAKHLKSLEQVPLLLLGARSENEIALSESFKNNGIPVKCTTNDGSVGLKGYVTELSKKIFDDDDFSVVYACGPHPMLKEIARQSMYAGVPCQVCLEEYMACGVGVCMGCAVKTRENGNIVYQRVCKEGPVFWADNICWDDRE